MLLGPCTNRLPLRPADIKMTPKLAEEIDSLEGTSVGSVATVTGDIWTSRS